MSFQRKILVTGGAGFIGSHVVRLFVNKYPQYLIFNLDKLTYAGNLENLKDFEKSFNYRFIKGDIVDESFVLKLFEENKFDGVIHLAAESHVDRSIVSPTDFIFTNIVGTVNVLNAAGKIWDNLNLNNKGQVSMESEEQNPISSFRFYHISTDEVYGSLDETGYFTESTPYDPRSPYSASKAAADHLVRAYAHTYNLPVVVTNCSNNYGPYQFPEKLIPLAINNIKNNLPVPVYGKGENTRDWLWVEDHAAAIDLVFHKGRTGATYNIGGFNEWKNLDVIHMLCKIMDEKLGRIKGKSEELITFVKDRPGHDMRYAIDSSLISKELGWKPSLTFEEGLSKTVDWYLANEEWLQHITSGAYQQYYQQQYHQR
ncbi:MAG: dTDP-glucose 4,6-dehydratase [Chitinophagales bacterium]|nr:dTDP-glucose 4,6-dehydratase [Chitinophagales bacterium]